MGMPAQTLTALLGNWGGEGIRMNVGLEEGGIWFNCIGDGTIDAAIVPDASGHFQVEGTLENIILNIDLEVPPRAAVYEGTIASDSMQLSITVRDTGLSVGSYTLTRGDAGHLTRCG
jgi:hypothetical protein